MQFGTGIIQNGWQEAELQSFLGWEVESKQNFVIVSGPAPTHPPTKDYVCYPKTNKISGGYVILTRHH